MEFWLSSRKVNFLWSQSELDVQTVFKCCGRYLPSAVCWVKVQWVRDYLQSSAQVYN